MMKSLRAILLAACLFWLPAYAQDTSTAATSPTSSGATTTTGIEYPSTPTDNANGSHTDNINHDVGKLVNYYFVFFALLICIIALGAFLFWRRKKKLGVMDRHGRESALERDLDAWDPARSRRRYGQGRWRSAEEHHMEGLNEHGEAPPPYMPKARDEEEGASSRTNEPAVPLQTLSREQAGLKPPEYMEANARPLDDAGRVSLASGNNGAPSEGPHQQWR